MFQHDSSEDDSSESSSEAGSSEAEEIVSEDCIHEEVSCSEKTVPENTKVQEEIKEKAYMADTSESLKISCTKTYKKPVEVQSILRKFDVPKQNVSKARVVRHGL
ncbi:hypothetical protein L1987_15301 [Smallanthus sonchifolius]|uniref:Uncharacterized protein n=1 Tax=Smallanthus sonchifolius TaxID=185202 RepID=A0ACB9J5P6_9ASTR|nr:hypothetical protein L1987_15301 [Smallanthus sonchifolius]